MDNEDYDVELLPEHNLPEITLVSRKPGIAPVKAGSSKASVVQDLKPKNTYTLTIDYKYPWS